jgi:hypothetical protein
MWKSDIDVRQTSPGKFQGERMAVAAAYDVLGNGFADEDFGDSGTFGYYAKVTLDCEDGETIVYFVENSQGFVFEITRQQYEAARDDWTILEQGLDA